MELAHPPAPRQAPLLVVQGDAKTLTTAIPIGDFPEENPQFPFTRVDQCLAARESSRG